MKVPLGKGDPMKVPLVKGDLGGSELTPLPITNYQKLTTYKQEIIKCLQKPTKFSNNLSLFLC